MVITFACDVLGEENNGTTIATMNVARAMKAKGHEVRIICPDEDKKGLPGYYVVPKVNFGPFNGYVAHNGVVLASTKDKETIRKAIEGSDVVHFNFGGFLSEYCVKLCKELGIPTTASMHTQAENFTNHVGLQYWHFANWVWYKHLYRILFRHVDAIHYPSEFIHELFERECKFTKKSYVISNGIQNDFKRMKVERPEELQGKVLVAFTARYAREKKHVDLFRAMKYSKHNKDIVLLLPGAGPLEKKFRKKYSKWCANPPILGFHSHDEMVRLLNMVDIYCHVGRVDIEPISCLEAISIGLPPILTDSKFSSVSSFAIDPKLNVYHAGDAKDLARHIDYFIDHPDIANENGKKYRGYAERFDFQTSMDKMEQMYLEVIENHRKAQ
jgi:glycosyltransferase involved in cell wall biosynthesis